MRTRRIEWRMSWKTRVRFVILVTFLLSFQFIATRFYYSSSYGQEKILSNNSSYPPEDSRHRNSSNAPEKSVEKDREHVVIASVVCGWRREFLEMALTMMKSAVLFKGESQLTFIIFTDTHLRADLHKECRPTVTVVAVSRKARLIDLENNGVHDKLLKVITDVLLLFVPSFITCQQAYDFWLRRLQSQVSPAQSFSYDLRNVSYPDDGHEELRRELSRRNGYRLGSLLRLYLPAVIPDYPNALYVDVDVIFLNELSNTWQHLKRMNASQIAAVSPDHEDPVDNPYKVRQTNIIPFYGETGLNAGVILMNLEKMREMKWVDEVNAILKNDLRLLDVFDQDIINIFFHNHPDKLYFNSCKYNYNWFLSVDKFGCKRKSLCQDAQLGGISILHGHSKAFDWSGIYSAIYRTFKNYELGTDVSRNMIELLRSHFTFYGCQSLENEFMKNFVRLFDKKNIISST